MPVMPLMPAAVVNSSASGTILQTYDNLLALAAANFDITAIPANGRVLLIRGLLANDSGSADNVKMHFNNDTGSNYGSQSSEAVSTTSAAQQFITTTRAVICGCSGTANIASGFFLEIPLYSASTYNKTWNCVGNYSTGIGNSSTVVTQRGGLWANSSAITRVTIAPDTASNFKAGSWVGAWLLGVT